MYYCTIAAPPIPTEVTAQLMNASSFRVAWQWTSSGSTPNCFNTTSFSWTFIWTSPFSWKLSRPCFLVALFPGLHTVQFLITCSFFFFGYYKQLKTGWWEGPGTRLVFWSQNKLAVTTERLHSCHCAKLDQHKLIGTGFHPECNC